MRPRLDFGGGAYETEAIRLLRDCEGREKWLIKQSSWAQLERWPRRWCFIIRDGSRNLGVSETHSDTRKLNLINNAWQEVGASSEVCALKKKNIYIYLYCLIYISNTHKVSLSFLIFLKTLNLPNPIANLLSQGCVCPKNVRSILAS